MYGLVDTLFQIYRYMIIGYILLSWIPSARESFIGELLGRFVEPYLAPFRKVIPPIGGMIDISPIVALFALFFIQYGVFAILSMFL
ncbi:YggT family protein [Xylanibacillus composti]|nr:YggT family protein [Xylanibacillus composti]